MIGKKAPSLLEMCVTKAIDNVKYLGDVGDTDSDLLDRILNHCTVDQLRHIEKSTKGRDLSPVTNKYWKKFYERKFGVAHTNEVVERIEKKNATFTWMQLYEAKELKIAKKEKLSIERMAKRYKEEDAKKQGRGVQICTKAPPANKRSFYAGGFGSFTKESSIMKKAKTEFLQCYEVKNLKAMRRNTIKPNYTSPVKPGGLSAKNQAPSSRGTKLLSKRY